MVEKWRGLVYNRGHLTKNLPAQGGNGVEDRASATKTITTVMVMTLLGKLLGLYRDRLVAIHYSVGPEASAFFTASRIPRVFFDAVFASAIAACFIPVFSEYLEKRTRKEALEFASSFLTIMALLTGGLTLLGMAFPQPLVALFADYQDPQTTALAVSLTQVLFPTVLCSGVAFSLVGILQAQEHFTAPALMSAVSNLVVIGYFFFGNSTFGIYGLAGAYLAGWLLQGLIQLPPLKILHVPLRPRLDFRSSGVRRVFALMGPVMVSTWVQPINLAINARFGSRLYEGAGVSVMEYSSNLYLVITGTFILSITNVIFPRLSRLTAGGQEGRFRDTLRQTVHSSLFFVLPMSAGLMAVARPLVSFLYGGGAFGESSVALTASALGWLSLGMGGYAVQNILSRAWFARQDGKAPLIAGAASIGVNVVLCAALAPSLEAVGLALASAVSSTVYAGILLLLMERRGEGILNRGMLLDIGKMLAAALGTGLWAAWVLSWLTRALPVGKTGELAALGGTALLGVAMYFLLALALGLQEAKLVLSLGKNLKRG